MKSEYEYETELSDQPSSKGWREELISWAIVTPFLLSVFWVLCAPFFRHLFLHTAFVAVPDTANHLLQGLLDGERFAVIQASAYFVLSIYGTAFALLMSQSMLPTIKTDHSAGATMELGLGFMTCGLLAVLMAIMFVMSYTRGLMIGPLAGALAALAIRAVMLVGRIKMPSIC